MYSVAKGDRILQVATKEDAEMFVRKYGFHYIPKSTVRRIQKKLRKVQR